MNKNAGKADIWLWLTVPIAMLLATAAGAGVFIRGLYRDTPNLVVQAVAQDTITFMVALPTLVIGAFLASRGSQRARLIWMGALTYLVYTYVGYAFDIRFNPLFLIYVALLGCSTYTLIGSLVTADWAGIKAVFTERTPVKSVSVFLTLIVGLFYLLWLSEAVPASLTGETPQSVKDVGTPTNLVHVLDMAWTLPALAITAVNLWRKQPVGYGLAGPLLTFLALLLLAILSMAVFMGQAGESEIIPQLLIFGTLFAISVGMLMAYLKNLKSSHMPTQSSTRSTHPISFSP